MTAVAAPPSFSQMPRPPWVHGGPPSHEDVRSALRSKKTSLPRSNSSSSMSSTSSTSSATTFGTHNASVNANSTPPLFAGTDLQTWSNPAPRMRPQPKSNWTSGKSDEFTRPAAGRGGGGTPIIGQGPMQPNGGPQLQPQQNAMRPNGDVSPQGQPVLYLLSMNGSFDRKTITVPFTPDCVKIGRQTNAKTAPTALNGFFDSKVLSRSHAEIWADRSGKIWIRDVKSSNGTFVNGQRLSPENRESEAHELQTADHLELGIDIVNEDQKTIIHHKVSAKVEHAGFPTPSNSVLDMNFGDLDPANGGMIMSGAVPVQFRQRAGSNAAMVQGMMRSGNVPGQPGGPGQQRQFWMAQVTTEHIVKRLHNELRGARLTQQDLSRTAQVVGVLGGGKGELKHLEKPDTPEHPVQPGQSPIINGGHGVSFRSDAKARFTDPPAPPPSQPLPDKPDAVPSLKRSSTERPKSNMPPGGPPPQQENISQIVLLTEALDTARKDFDSQSARVRELESLLAMERAARELAESFARKIEEPSPGHINGKHTPPDTASDEVFEPPPASKSPKSDNRPLPDGDKGLVISLQTRIDSMTADLHSLRSEMDSWKNRAEHAVAEKDATVKTLAEMVLEARKEKEMRKASTERKRRSRSRRRSKSEDDESNPEGQAVGALATPNGKTPELNRSTKGRDDSLSRPTLSRWNTITPGSPQRKRSEANDPIIAAALPLGCMLGVVLLGYGLMAYMNSWQTAPKSLR